MPAKTQSKTTWGILSRRSLRETRQFIYWHRPDRPAIKAELRNTTIFLSFRLHPNLRCVLFALKPLGRYVFLRGLKLTLTKSGQRYRFEGGR